MFEGQGVFLLKKLINKIKLIKYKFQFKNLIIGKDVFLGNNFLIYNYSNFDCEIGDYTFFRGYLNLIFFKDNRYNLKIPKLIIGKDVFFNLNCSISVGNGIICIGDNCLFGENVKLYNHNHCFNQKNHLISKQGYSFEDIYIGNNVWIGSNVLILKGASIGDNSVISAGSILKSKVPANHIFINNKIEAIKYR